MASLSEKISRLFSNWSAAADDDYDEERGANEDPDMFEEEDYSGYEFGTPPLNQQFRNARRDAHNAERRPREGRQQSYRQGDPGAQQAGRQRGGQYDSQYARHDGSPDQGDYSQEADPRGDYADADYRGQGGGGQGGGDQGGYDRQGAYGAGEYGRQPYRAPGRDGSASGAGQGLGAGAGARAGQAGQHGGGGMGGGIGGSGMGGGGMGGGGRGGQNNVLPFPQRGSGSVVINAKPERYNDAQMICQHLRERHIVIFSLEDMEHDQARRVFDFVSGGVTVLDATIEKHSRMIFSVAPNNVVRMPFKDESHDPGFETFGGSIGSSRARSTGGTRGEY